MNKQLLRKASKRLDRNKLVAKFMFDDFKNRNIMPIGSDDFVTGWEPYSTSSMVVTPNQLVPEWNTNEAYRLQSPACTTATRWWIRVGVGAPGPFIWSIKVKNIGSSVVKFSVSSTIFDVNAGETKDVQIQFDESAIIYINTLYASSVIDCYVYQSVVNVGSKPLPVYKKPSGVPQTLWNSLRKSINVTNIIQNGNFANGTLWWTANYYCSVSILNNILSAIGDGSNASPFIGNITNGIWDINGQKLYSICKVRVTNNVCNYIRIEHAGVVNTINNPIQDKWYNLSGIYTRTSNDNNDIRTYIRHNYSDANIANGKIMEIQKVMTIDLTSLFGVGKEPTLEQCDQIFQFWFDGTVRMNIFGQLNTKQYLAMNNINNGNFVDGITGYTSESSTLRAENNTLINTADGTQHYMRTYHSTDVPIIPTNKYYFRGKFKVTNSDCINMKARIFGTTSGTGVAYSYYSFDDPVLNKVYNLSGISIPLNCLGNVGVYFQHEYIDAATSNGKEMEVQELLCIDLTSVFGSGNEPTLEQCDQIFSIWFDETKYVDYKNFAGHCTLGSTIDIDTNDPVFISEGLQLDGIDNFAKGVIPFNPNKDFTIFMATYFSDTVVEADAYFSLCNSKQDLPYLMVYENTGNDLAIYTVALDGSNNFISTKRTPGNRIIYLKKKGNDLYIGDVESGKNANEPFIYGQGIDSLFIGCNGRPVFGYDRFINTNVYAMLCISKFTTKAEDIKIYNYLKTKIRVDKGVIMA